MEAELTLIREGTKNQKMTASYFNHSLQEPKLKMQAAKEVILKYPDDLELVACFLPGFLEDASYELHRLVEDKGRGYWSLRDAPARKPDTGDLAKWFKDKEEVRKFYGLLKGILNQLPKKGIVLDPCIFPWHRVVTVSYTHLTLPTNSA